MVDAAEMSHTTEAEALEQLIDRRLAARFAALESRISELIRGQDEARGTNAPGMAMIVCSGDVDKLLAAFTLAVSAAAAGLKVNMFFAFWAVLALRRRTVFKGKNLLQRIMTGLLPSGPKALSTSQMNCLGAGPRLLGLAMRRRGVPCLQDLMGTAAELKVRMVVCETSMELMGFTRTEMIDGLEYGGATSFLDSALEARLTLFI